MTELEKAINNEEYGFAEHLLRERFPDVPRREISIVMQKLIDGDFSVEWFDMNVDAWLADVYGSEGYDV